MNIRITTGPWRVERGNVGAEHPLFVTAPGHNGIRPWCDEDAYLIAAAPELYRVLELLTLWVSCDSRCCDVIPQGIKDNAADVIAMARGWVMRAGEGELVPTPEHTERQSKWKVNFKQPVPSSTERQAIINAPKTCNMMVVCTNSGHGLIPWRLKLLHQLYESDLADILKERPDTQSIVCIPAKCEEYVYAWGKDDK